MKSTLKQQISAVNFSRKHFAQVEYDYDKLVKTLNDAASTISALNLIGTEVVLIAPELVTTVKQFLKHCGNGTPTFEDIKKLQAIINRLPK